MLHLTEINIHLSLRHLGCPDCLTFRYNKKNASHSGFKAFHYRIHFGTKWTEFMSMQGLISTHFICALHAKRPYFCSINFNTSVRITLIKVIELPKIIWYFRICCPDFSKTNYRLQHSYCVFSFFFFKASRQFISNTF